MNRRCIVVLGGSFDPVHRGHVALAKHFAERLQPDMLRIIPAGNPWQKPALKATPEQRIAMLERAFADLPYPVSIDMQEVARSSAGAKASYTIDTLRALRVELGEECALALLIGADQLQNLHSWREWQSLFDLAHVCAATRPGYSLAAATLDPAVAKIFAQRAIGNSDIRARPSGGALLAEGLAVDVSATAIRAALAQLDSKQDSKQNSPQDLLSEQLPAAVLDYIQEHHLYLNS